METDSFWEIIDRIFAGIWVLGLFSISLHYSGMEKLSNEILFISWGCVIIPLIFYIISALIPFDDKIETEEEENVR